MSIRTRLAAAAAAGALVLVGAGTAAPAQALSGEETSDFLGQLTATYNDPTGPADNDPYDFDIVTKAVLATGADATLASLPAFTVFAPNDRAFEVLANRTGALGPNYRYGATVDEAKVFNALVAKLGVDKIREVLLYHVLPARVTGKQVLSGPFFQRPTMANGQKLGITVLSRSASFPVIILDDRDGRLFNDQVVKSRIDAVKTPNTVVHGISDVLMP
jgi:uncharacterized surface protein with fasciclin (FAS1) repeats